MALTSDKLKEMTRRKLELVKGIDRNPCDERLKQELADVEAEISGERHALITNDAELAAPHPAAAPAPIPEITPSPKAKGKKEANAGGMASRASGSKKLSDFF
jgi:hypothetical protein